MAQTPPRRVQPPSPTARQSVAAWIAVRTQGLDEINIAEIVAEAYDAFDDETLLALGRESLHQTVITQTRRVIARTRSPFRPKPMKFAVLDEETRRRGLIWERFMEWTGERHVRLMTMTKAQLEAAASIRFKRGDREIGYAVLWQDLADTLAPDQRLEEVFSADDIARKALGIRVTVEGQVLDWSQTLEEIVQDSLDDAAEDDPGTP